MRRLSALLAAALAGCVSGPPPSSLEVSDSGVFMPAIRASIGEPAGERARSDPQPGSAIELGASRASGAGTQALVAGQQPARFGGREFSPPLDLAHDFEFRYFEASFRWRGFLNEAFGLELLGGLGYAALDLAVSSATQRAAESIDALGGTAGLGIVLRLRPGTSVQARLTWFASGAQSDVSHARRFELALAQSLGRHAGVRAGYVTWKVDSEREFQDLSPLKLEFSGPALGLELMF